MKKPSIISEILDDAVDVTNKFVRYTVGLFGVKQASSRITLVADGVKSINIRTGFTPKEVWINPLERRGIPVCQSEPDWFSREIVPGGFVLLVKLNSEFRTVEWIAEG